MLSATALAVRGGGSGFEAALLKNARVTWEQCGRPGLSIYAAELTLPELLRRSPGIVKYVRTTTVGLLRVHFEVEWTGEWPHATVWLPNLSPRTFRLFTSCFSAAIDLARIDTDPGDGSTTSGAPTLST